MVTLLNMRTWKHSCKVSMFVREIHRQVRATTSLPQCRINSSDSYQMAVFSTFKWFLMVLLLVSETDQVKVGSRGQWTSICLSWGRTLLFTVMKHKSISNTGLLLWQHLLWRHHFPSMSPRSVMLWRSRVGWVRPAMCKHRLCFHYCQNRRRKIYLTEAWMLNSSHDICGFG